jgi:hypothetical protein
MCSGSILHLGVLDPRLRGERGGDETEGTSSGRHGWWPPVNALGRKQVQPILARREPGIVGRREVKRVLIYVLIVVALVSCLGGGVASALTEDIYIHAENVYGEGDLLGNHNYISYSATQWKNTNMIFVVAEPVQRNENDVKYYIYSDNALAHSREYYTIVGNTSYTKSTNVITQKLRSGHAGTYSSWYVSVDLNNAPDPDGWDYTQAF